MTAPSAIVLLFDGVEEMEAVAPIDLLRRADVAVTTAATGASASVIGRNNIRLVADCLLKDCEEQSFDLVVLPGGPGHQALLENTEVLNLLKRQASSDKLLASICAGPVVLDKAGLLAGKSFTSFPGTQEQLPLRDPVNKVVKDGKLITSQGAGTAREFALTLVEALCGSEKSVEITNSICAS
jgi:4-methyl-5(b-hydroxyethyl)-thiazole monophosphate biosynthesis